MTDADVSSRMGGVGGGDDGHNSFWGDPRLDTKNLFHDMDTEQLEGMRVSFNEERDARRSFGVGGGGGGWGGTRDSGVSDGGQECVINSAGRVVTQVGAEMSVPMPSPWSPLPTPAPRPVLADAEDAMAAAEFRPLVSGAESRVLQLLANAWTAAPGEMKDQAARGAVRAGRTAADLGLRFGRGFGASWGPRGQLVCPGAVGGGGRGGRAGCHTIRVLQFDPTPAASGRGAKELYLDALRNHQRFAVPMVSDGGRKGEDSPPRWTLPRRVMGRPDSYEALVQCMHGYAAAHALAATAFDRNSNGNGLGTDPENSPEWVLEQAWRLSSAMWGQEEGEGKSQDLPMPSVPSWPESTGERAWEDSDGASPHARREAAVAHWLANAVSSCVRAVTGRDASGRTDGDSYPWRTVLELLSVRRVDEAAKLAATAGLPRLAVVLGAAGAAAGSQGGGWVGAGYPSASLASQAALWQAGGADARMPPEAFAVYQLLGREGFRDVQLRGVIGKASDARHPSLDWLRQLGLCMWFGAGAPAGGDAGGRGRYGVAEALNAYESLVTANEALPPTARYFHEPTHHDKADLEKVGEELRRVHVGGGGEGGRYADADKVSGGGNGCIPSSGRDRCVLVRLLALYPSTTPPGGAGGAGAAAGALAGSMLLSALEPLAVTPDVMDYRHSWHLMTVVEALAVAEVPDRCTAMAVAEGLRFQLESAGLWEWAVYVALTAEGDADRREATAHELVLRHGHGLLNASFGSPSEERRRLLDEFGVPAAWLHEAAAVRAG